MNLDIGTWQLIFQLVGILSSLSIFVYIVRQQNKLVRSFTPVIRNVMSNLGKASVESREVKQIESKIMENVVNAGLPELDILKNLGILDEELVEQIKEHPQAIMTLIQRYAPLIKMIAGKMGGGSQQPSYAIG